MKPRVLMVAYACDPEGTGEHWLGWGWALQASQNHQVDLITTPKARAAVELASAKAGITAHCVEIPAWFRHLTEAVGAGWLRKLLWQRKVERLAHTLHARTPFAIAHQTTFHSFRMPFRAASIGIPSVWGPIAGGERVPPGFERYLGAARVSEASRRIANRLCLGSASVRASLNNTSAIFVSNHTTLQFLPERYREKCTVVPPNALRPEDEQRADEPLPPKPRDPERFELLYAGYCVATRAVPLVMDAMRRPGLETCRLTVVGSGPALEPWKAYAARCQLIPRVIFTGHLPHAKLTESYQSADALVFPALRDSGGSALLEAMSRGLPVVCLDWAGPGEMVDAQSGVKIPVRNPSDTVQALASALVSLRADPARRHALAGSARLRASRLFRWDAKRALLEETYRRLMG